MVYVQYWFLGTSIRQMAVFGSLAHGDLLDAAAWKHSRPGRGQSISRRNIIAFYPPSFSHPGRLGEGKPESEARRFCP